MFTKEEKDFITKVILNVSLQGTIQTLPKMLEVAMNILKKLDGEIETQPEEGHIEP
jgi:hypothetical protein